MRINDDLEKKILELEGKNIDNGLSLLDAVRAIEKAYNQINASFLKKEKDFEHNLNNYYTCKKTKYDSNKGRTIYTIFKGEDKSSILELEIANNGEISFNAKSNNNEEVNELIEELNKPSNETMEKMKMNADLSFFTENRELILSENPYLAIKMGNFIEGDKAILVYKEEKNSGTINKQEAGLKYVRIDQIEGYLKNIKVDERTIPTLAYAYIGHDYENDFCNRIEEAEISTYPRLTEEKQEEYQTDYYLSEIGEISSLTSICGGFLGGIVGSIIGTVTPIPFLPALLIGAGAPLLTGGAIYCNGLKNVRQANKKDELLDRAFINLYSTLKKYANYNITVLEKEFTRKREKQNKKETPIDLKNITTSELARYIRNSLTDTSLVNSSKVVFCKIALNQILNSYTNKDSISKINLANDTEFYDEIIELNHIISNRDEMELTEVVDYTVDTVKRLLPKSNPGETIEVLNSLEEARNSKTSNGNKWEDDIKNCYLETLLLASASEDGLAIQTVSLIPENTQTKLLNHLHAFARKLECSTNISKYRAGVNISNKVASNLPHQGMKLIEIMNFVNEEELVYDLLGKKLSKEKAKIKVKENLSE